jgi:hypothetical protein
LHKNNKAIYNNNEPQLVIFWFVYFILLGAWSALAGVIVFLLYTPWRNYYRKYHPIEK